MGAHPKAPSKLLGEHGAVAMDAAIANNPQTILGTRSAAEFHGALPFLFKVLAAHRPLSIQAHPTLQQAKNGYARDILISKISKKLSSVISCPLVMSPSSL